VKIYATDDQNNAEQEDAERAKMENRENGKLYA